MQLQLVSNDMINVTYVLQIIIKGLKEIAKRNRTVNTTTKS